jgi:predicted permease
MTPGFISALGIQITRGRNITDADGDSLAPRVLVNEEYVRRVFPNEDPLGKRIKRGSLADVDEPWYTIVGVVPTYRHYRLPEPMGPAVFYPYSTWPTRSLTVVVKTTHADAHVLDNALRSAVRSLDREVALYQVQTMEEAVSRSLWRQRLQGRVLGIFAALALVLASIGLYGVISYAVAQRTREIGVRMALGARRADVVRLVLLQSGALVVLGVVLGLVLGRVGARTLTTLLYEVQPGDPVTFAAVAAVLGAVGLLASLVPARRATRVDPLEAMRAD